MWKLPYVTDVKMWIGMFKDMLQILRCEGLQYVSDGQDAAVNASEVKTLITLCKRYWIYKSQNKAMI